MCLRKSFEFLCFALISFFLRQVPLYWKAYGCYTAQIIFWKIKWIVEFCLFIIVSSS